MTIFQSFNNRFKIVIFAYFFISINSYAEDYYWVGNSGNWSDFANHWSVSSGGSTMHSALPTIADNVFFDENSLTAASNVVFDLVSMKCKSFDCSAIIFQTTVTGTSLSTLEVYGDWISSTMITNSFLGKVTFASASSSLIKSEGVSFSGQIDFDGIGSWELKDDFQTLGVVKVIKGSLATGNATQLLSGSFDVSCAGLFINGVKPRTLKAGTSLFTITGADTAFIFSPVNLFLYEDLATFKFTNMSTDTVRFFSSGVTDTITNLNISSSIILFEDESAFKNIVSVPGSGIIIKEKKTLSANSLSIDGTCSLVSLISSSSSDTALLKVIGGATINYNSIKGINAISGSYVASNSFDNGANKGWTINEIASNGYVYWTANGSNDNWSNPDNWSTNCIPGPNDTVVFNSASFSINNQIVNLDIDGYAYAMRWEGTTNNPEFSGADYNLRLKNELTIDVPIVSSFSGNSLMVGDGIGTIKTNGVIQNSEFSFENICNWTFLDGFNSNQGIDIIKGSLDFGSYSHSIDHLTSTSTNNRVIDLNNACIEIKGTANAIEFESAGFTLNTTSSTLKFTNTTNSLFSRLISSAISYDTIVVSNLSTHVYGSNTFKCIKVDAGSELLFEGGQVQNIDSLISFGTCENIVRLGAINSGELAAQIYKTGYKSLQLKYVEINHLDAQISSGETYTLKNSSLHNSTINWSELASSFPSYSSSLIFNASESDYVEVQNMTTLPVGKNERTISAWFNVSNITNNGNLISYGEGDLSTSKQRFSLAWIGQKFMIITQNHDWSSSVSVSNNGIVSGQWHHVAVTLRNDTIKIYLDGIPQDSTSLFNDINTINSSNKFFIGKNTYDRADEYFDGKIRDVGVWDVALSKSAITEIMSFCNVNNYPNLLGFWRCNESSGSVVNDFSSNVNNGAVNGASWDMNSPSLSCGTPNGRAFYWRTDQGNWGDVSNWESPLGFPATCLPTIKDTVYFDANSFTLQDQIVTVDVPASAKIISWNGSGSFKPLLHFNKSMNIKKDMLIDPGISFTSSGSYPELKFIPDGENGSFETNDIPIDVNITIDGKISSDGIALTGDLKMTNNNYLKVIGGAFHTNGDSIFVGELDLNATSSQVDLGTSVFTIFEKIDMRGTGLIDLSNSIIHFAKNCYSSSIYADSRNFNYLKIYGNSSSITTFNGTNSINSLEIEKGSRVQFEENKVLTINLSFLANGECESDTIYLSSTIAGTSSSINCANSLFPTLEVCNLKDINSSGNTITVLFGDNSGGNTNISFSAIKSSTPLFTRTFHNCFGTAVDFNNISVDYLLGTNLTYLWDFGDESTSTDQVPNHTYASDGTYFIELTSFYTNGCYEFYYDSVRVNDPSIILSSTESDTAICIGDEVSFSVSSPGASNLEFFLNTISVQNGVDTSYVTSSLLNEDSIRVLVTLNGCPKMSDALPFKVNLYPTVSLLSSDLDDVICNGDSVIFSVTGASNYLFAVDGIDIGYYDIDSIYKTNSITDGQTISVYCKDTLTGCALISPATYQFTVNENPVPLVSTSDNDLVICQGDLVTFTASGASEFEFFVSGSSTQSLSANSIFNTSSLLNGQTVTIAGTTLGCTTLSADSTFWFVNPLPPVVVSNNSINNSICEGDFVDFSVNGASFYEFFNNGVSVQGPSGANTFLINSLSNGDVISVTGTQSGCVKNIQSPSIGVTLLPIVDLISSDSDNSICSDELVVFTGSGASNYSFYIDGILATGINNSFIYSTDSIFNGQTISVSGESGGCSDFSGTSYSFIVEPPINLNFSLVSSVDTICEGENVLFSSYGFGVSQYDIEVNTINYGTSLSGDFDVVLPVGLNIIKLIGTKNGCQKYADNEFQIYVNALPIVALISSDADNIICDNDSVVFNASSASFYEFFIDGFSQGVSSNQDSIILTGILNGQSVSVQGVENGCVNSSIISYTFVVNDSPSLTLSSDDLDGIICQSTLIQFTTTGADQYQYNVNGVNISGYSALSSYSTDSLLDGEVVFVEGVSNGCYSLDSISITVNPLPNPRMTLNDPDTTSCAGETISIVANGSSLFEFFIANVSQGSPSVNPSFSTSSLIDGQQITLAGTSNVGCVSNSIDTITYTILPLPLISVSVNVLSNNLCNGDLVAFSTVGPDSINYYLNGIYLSNNPNYSSDSILNGDVVTINGFSNGCFVSADSTYQFTVYNYPLTTIQTTDLDTVICNGDLIEFIGYGALEYDFAIDGVSLGVSINDTLFSTTISNGQIVNVTGYNNGCSSSSSDIVVVVNSYPVTSLSSSDLNDTICYGELVTFSASGASNYEFFNNTIELNSSVNSSITLDDLESGDSLFVVGYNGECSISSNDFVFHVYKMDLEIQSSTNNMICDGESIEFQCLGADEYEFLIDGNTVQAMGLNNIFLANNLLNGQTVSFKGLNNVTGCIQNSNNEQLIVVLNNPTISMVGPISLCEGDSVILVSDYSYLNQWYVDSTEIIGATYDSYVVSNTGNYQTAIILGGDYEIESVGNNTYGQLGNDDFVSSVISQDVVSISGIAQINSGKYFNVALDTLGDLYCWGKNDFGQLGDSTYGSKNKPVLVISKVLSSSAGDRFTVIVKNNGNVMTWGDNNAGQLGLGNFNTTNYPSLLSGISSVIDVKAGSSHVIALDNSGNVYSWGNNQYGQLGTGNLISSNVPVPCNISAIAKIGVGSNHCFAIDSSGVVWAWGDNQYGQLGIGNFNFQSQPIQLNLRNINTIDGGENHSVAVSSNGSLYCWGANFNGQLGDSTNIDSYIPLKITSIGSVFNAEAGFNNTFVNRKDNSVWSFGRNTNYQLADQTNIDRNYPIHISKLTGATDFGLGYSHSSILSSSKTSCISSEVIVDVLPAPPVIIIVVDTFFFASETGTSYQWFLNGNPIFINGNDQSIVPYSTGYYSVEVTYSNGCVISSNDYPYNIVDIQEISLNNPFKVFPNPSDGIFTVEKISLSQVELQIFNQLGQEVYKSVLNNQSTEVNLSYLSSGIYLIKISGQMNPTVKMMEIF